MGPNTQRFVTQLLPASGIRFRAHKSGRDGRLLTVADVAEELAVSTATVYKLVARGAPPCVRILNALRVRREDLEGIKRS